MATFMEISKLGMTFIGIILGMIQRMQRSIGIKHRGKDRVGKNMIRARTFTELGRLGAQNINRTKRLLMTKNIIQMQQGILKKKQSGEEDIPKKRKISKKAF